MTTENIQINIREDGARVVVVNITAIANASAHAASSTDMLRRALGTLGLVQLAKEFFQAADSIVLMEARLRLATKSSEEFAQASQTIYDLSQNNNVGLRETAKLYTKLAEPIRNLGGGMKEVGGIVDAFGSALRISGASTQEAAAATLQFSQAMSKGKLDGDEFRTMAEVAPRVMRAMADGMDVPIGKLKSMSSQGKLTADVIGNALLKELKTLKEEAASVGNTVAGSFSDLSNDAMIAVGAFDKMTGASQTLSGIIQGVSLIVFEFAKVFKDEIKDGTDSAKDSFGSVQFVVQALGIVFETLMVLGSEVSHIFKSLGNNIGGFAAQMGALAAGDFKTVGTIQQQMIIDNVNRLSELERFQKRIVGATDRALAAQAAARNAPAGTADTSFKGLEVKATEEDLIKVRMRLTGVNQQYFKDMGFLESALKNGQVTTKEYIKLMEELATKTFEASKTGKDLKKKVVGSDDRMKTMKEELVQAKMEADGEKTIFSDRERMLSFYHKRLGMSDDDFYAGRQNAREDYLKSEQNSYEKEKAIIESFKPKNANEVADNKLKLATLARDHQDFLNKMQSARSDDALNRMADERDVIKASDEATSKYLSSQYEVLEKLKETTAERERSAVAVSREAESVLKLAIANLQANNAEPITELHTQADIDVAEGFIATLQAELGLREGISAELQKQNAMKLKDASIKQQVADWKDAGKEIAEGLKATFGSLGESLGNFFKSYGDNVAEQIEITQRLQKTIKGLEPDDPQRIEAITRAREESANAQIKSYANMAGSAKNFFKENSTGYKVMEGTEKAFRAWQLANVIATSARKLMVEAASTAKSSALAGTEASAWSITAVVKAIASMPYPANLAAGAATLAAVIAIGAKLSGSISAGGQSAAQVQEKQGTGTVFGDDSAKSQTISRTLERLESHSGDLIPINQSMLMALRNIESSMKGVGKLIGRDTGLRDGTSMDIETGQLNIGKPTDIVSKVMTQVTHGLLGPGLGNVVAKFINNVWGKTKQNVVDSGLQFGGSVRGLQQGQGINEYASVDTTKSSWFGLSKKTTNNMVLSAASEEFTTQFALVFKNMETVLKEASVNMGGSTDQVSKALDGLNIDMTKLSVKGLKGDELIKEIDAVFSKALDQMAMTAFPEMKQFETMGESYGETVLRLATNYAMLDSSLATINKTFGATGVSSLGAREALIELMGGIDEMASSTSKFAELFLTTKEQLAPVQKFVDDTLSGMGKSSVKTRDQFKSLILSQDLTTVSGRETYATLMSMAEAFAKVTPAIKDTTRTAQSIDDEREDLQKQLNELTMSADQLRNYQKLNIDESNKFLFDAVTAAKAGKAAADERKGIQDQLDALTMTSTELLNKQRDALFGSNQALFDNLQVATKAKAIADERKTLQEELNQLTMTSTQLLIKQRDALDASNRAIFDQIQTVKNTRANATNAMTGLTAAVEKQKKDEKKILDDKIALINAEKDAAKSTASALTSINEDTVKLRKKENESLKRLVDDITSALDSMKPDDVASKQLNRKAAQSQLDIALSVAKLTGQLPDATAFASTLKGLSESTEGMFGSMEEERVDKLRTAGKLADLNLIAGVQLTQSEQALNIAESQLEISKNQFSQADDIANRQIQILNEQFEKDMLKYDTQLEMAQKQLDIQLGTYVATLSVRDAMLGFNAALLNLQMAQQSSYTTATVATGPDGGTVTEHRASANQGSVAVGSEEVEKQLAAMVSLLQDIATSNTKGATAQQLAATVLESATKGRPFKTTVA